MYELYRYIHVPDGVYSRDDVLELKYKTPEELNGKFVVNAIGKGFRVYPSHEHYLQHLMAMPESERVFHEVILQQPQKLKFDIDAPVELLEKFEIFEDNTSTYDTSNNDIDESVVELFNDIGIDLNLVADSDAMSTVITPTDAPTPTDASLLTKKYKNIFDNIMNTIRDTYFITYGKDIPDLINCESKSNGIKYSNHVIIDSVYVDNPETAAEFTRRVREYLPERYRPFLDMSVNKRIQNFRSVFCHKDGDSRTKMIVSGQHPSRSFITNISGCELLPKLEVESNKITPQSIHPDDVSRVLNICASSGILIDHKYRYNRGGLFVFMRLRPSYCEFCRRNHDNDNTVIVSVQNIDGVVAVFKQCRKYIDEHGKDGTHSAIIGSFPSDFIQDVPNDDSSKAVKWCANAIARALAVKATPFRTLFEDLNPANKSIYCEPSLRPFENVRTLVVHAKMKMGKTKALRDYIYKYFPKGLNTPIIRILSFRQTFSGNIKEKFPEFTLYSELKGNINCSQLIIQVESLYRMMINPGDEVPDLLVLDECESIFEQFGSGLQRDKQQDCFEKFRYLMRYSKHIVCMDANISDRTYRLLEIMRGLDGVLYHCNRYKNCTEDNYILTPDKYKWLALLYSAVEADEPIAVPISSKEIADTIVRNLTKKYPNKKIKLYSSETSMSEKREHFSDVNAFWKEYDVLVYTPTVSAGVSFEQKHFRKIFGYFTDLSCPVETCGQMIGRIRDVGDKKYYICIQATGNNLPTDIDALKQQLYNRRENLMREFDHTGLRFEYNANGQIIYHRGDYFQLWLENARIQNLSKNSFIKRFVAQVVETGAKCEQLTDAMFSAETGLDVETADIIDQIKSEHSVVKSEIKADVVKKIAESRDITEIEAEDIRELIVAQKDITEKQKYEFEKYRLRSEYKYDGIIDVKFVGRYHDSKMRRIFKNLKRITAHPDITSALAQIQAEERANHKYLMELGEKQHYQDISRKYVFDQHRYALSLLKLCGWKNVNDLEYKHAVVLEKNLRDNEKIYWDNIKQACSEFGLRSPVVLRTNTTQNEPTNLPQLAWIEGMLKPINKILDLMYGITIASKKKTPDMYSIVHNSNFTTDLEVSKAKNKPML